MINRLKFPLVFKTWILVLFSNSVYSQNLVLQLTPSTYNGYNISCFGGTNGAINLTVYNGVAPYTYIWTNEATTEDISNLSEGYYNVVVRDYNGLTAEAQITLTEPEPFEGRVELWKYTHINGYNTSCTFCNDGVITTSVEGGIQPYSFQWTDGAITQDRSGIGSGEYQVIVSDANGCTVSEGTYITAPARDDWTMSGNTGTNPNNHFIGTSDNKGLIFRTHSSSGSPPRLEITNTGDIKVNSLSGLGTHLIYADQNGKLLKVDPGTPGTLAKPWMTNGNSIGPNDFIGTTNEENLRFQVFGLEQMRLETSGSLYLKHLDLANDGIIFNDDGYVENIDFTNKSQFLLGDGTFSSEIVHNIQGGGLQLHQFDLGGNIRTNEIKFLHNNVAGWAIGSRLGSGTPTPPNSFFIWNNLLAIPTTSLYIDGSTNYIGIGGNNIPEVDLDLRKNGDVAIRAYSSDGNSAKIWTTNLDFGYGFGIDMNNFGHIYYDYNLENKALSISTQGKIGINCLPPYPSSNSYQLFVEGGIMAREVKVTATTFADYVFDNDYELLTINEFGEFIRNNKHLPGMPSAQNILDDNGFEIGAMQVKLLEKVEEQALYIIELQRQIDILIKRLDADQ